MRLILLTFFALSLSFSVTNAAEADPPQVDALWLAAVDANPDIKDTEKFYRDYAKRILKYMKDFDGYIGALREPDNFACRTNLLCRDDARIIPAFRASAKPTAIDFIRYVRTSTCYGIAADKQTDFLNDLERSLEASGVELEKLMPEQTTDAGKVAKYFTLYVLAEARAIEDDTLILQLGDRDFRKLSELLRIANGHIRITTRPALPFFDTPTTKVVNRVCATAYGR